MKLRILWLLGSLLIDAGYPAARLPLSLATTEPSASHRSEAAPANSSRLVCYFEPQPELLAGGGGRVIVAAVQQRLIYPPHPGLVCLTGQTFVKFTITPAGEVTHIEVVKGLWPPFDSAAVQAVRQLPCFKSMARAMSCIVPIKYGR